MSRVNSPVLVGTVPLLFVQSMHITEGYRVERLAGSAFSQAVAPSDKTIAIEALLVGPDRLARKAELEGLALVSRVMVATLGSAVAGIPVVSGLTISLDMQITDLQFSASATQRDALEVGMLLVHVPRSSLTAILGAVADLALGAGTAIPATPPLPAPLPRVPFLPL